MRIVDYESLGFLSLALGHKPAVLEAYSGAAVVQWYGSIEGQLARKEQEYRAANNAAVADRLHTFLQTWRDHEITGSINIETLDALIAAASQNSVGDWRLADYFRNLRDALRALAAAQEELPVTAATPQRRHLSLSHGPRSEVGGAAAGEPSPTGAPASTGEPSPMGEPGGEG